MTGESRFVTYFRETGTDHAGLVLADDGTVWLVNPDGTRTQLPGSSGSQPQTATHTFTLNRAGGFVDSLTFDLGHDAAFRVLATMTLLSFTGDGETLGNDPGTLYVGGGSEPILSTNADNGVHVAEVAAIAVDHFVAAAGAFVFELQDDGSAASALLAAARYVKVKPQLVANDTAETYAGANDPVASVQVDLTY